MKKVLEGFATIIRGKSCRYILLSSAVFSLIFILSKPTNAQEQGSSPTITVSYCPDYFAYRPLHQNGFPGRKLCTRSNGVSLGIHFKKMASLWQKKMVTYKNQNFVESSFRHKKLFWTICGAQSGKRGSKHGVRSAPAPMCSVRSKKV